MVQSNDAAACISEKERYKYIDDLRIYELVDLAGILKEFDCYKTVPSDIGTDQLYLDPEDYATQTNLESISSWTDANLMKINVSKTNFMVFSRAKVSFGTKLNIDNVKLDKLLKQRLLESG